MIKSAFAPQAIRVKGTVRNWLECVLTQWHDLDRMLFKLLKTPLFIGSKCIKNVAGLILQSHVSL